MQMTSGWQLAIKAIDNAMGRRRRLSGGATSRSAGASSAPPRDRGAFDPDRGAIDERPGCAFGLATRRGLDDLCKDFDRLEVKVNGVLLGVATTLVVEVWRTWW